MKQVDEIKKQFKLFEQFKKENKGKTLQELELNLFRDLLKTRKLGKKSEE